MTRLRRFVDLVWHEAKQDKLIIRASGLAYSTLLALVPLIAVLFALFTVFDTFGELKTEVRDLLLAQLLPSGQSEIMQHIDGFVQNSRDLGFFGFVFLLVTAVLLLDQIDWNFNQVWRTRRRRSPLNRLTAYTFVLIFGSVLIGVSVSISARIAALLPSRSNLDFGVIEEMATWLFPVVSSFLAFLLLFKVIPVVNVRWRNAAIGAAFSAVSWELAKSVFALSVGRSVRYSMLYGSLAAVPIFLIWLYVTWILVLLGLEIAYVHQNRGALARTRHGETTSPRQRLILALGVAILVTRRFDAGDEPITENELAERLEVGQWLICETIEMLEDGGILRQIKEDDDKSGLIPARSVESIGVSDLIGAVYGESFEPPLDSTEEGREATRLVERFESAGREALDCRSLRDLAE